jgi:hypothetical protein
MAQVVQHLPGKFKALSSNYEVCSEKKNLKNKEVIIEILFRFYGVFRNRTCFITVGCFFGSLVCLLVYGHNHKHQISCGGAAQW